MLSRELTKHLAAECTGQTDLKSWSGAVHQPLTGARGENGWRKAQLHYDRPLWYSLHIDQLSSSTDV